MFRISGMIRNVVEVGCVGITVAFRSAGGGRSEGKTIERVCKLLPVVLAR